VSNVYSKYNMKINRPWKGRTS